MNQVFYKGNFTSIPSSWNELSKRQYIAACEVLVLPLPNAEKQVRLLKVLMGWSWIRFAWALSWFSFNPLRFLRIGNFGKRFGKRFGKHLDRAERFATAAEELTAFLFTECTLTLNLVPKYRRLYGPADELGNLRMGEFCYTEFNFSQWKATGEVKYLNALVACLYRPRKRHRDLADMRQPFDPHTTTLRIAQVEKWPLHVRQAIGINYGAMRQLKIEQNPDVFTGGDDDSKSLYGLWSVMRSVAKQGHFGKFDDVENTYVDTVLMDLNETLREVEEMKEQNTMTDD